jgi:hypothetical protein
MTDWVPAGSVAYDTAFADEDTVGSDRAMMTEGSVPWFSSIDDVGNARAAAEKAQRSPKKCHGNDQTCNGWKARGTDFCVGHLHQVAAETGVKTAREAADALKSGDTDDDEG